MFYFHSVKKRVSKLLAPEILWNPFSCFKYSKFRLKNCTINRMADWFSNLVISQDLKTVLFECRLVNSICGLKFHEVDCDWSLITECDLLLFLLLFCIFGEDDGKQVFSLAHSNMQLLYSLIKTKFLFLLLSSALSSPLFKVPSLSKALMTK